MAQILQRHNIQREQFARERQRFIEWIGREHGYGGEYVAWDERRNCFVEYGIHLAWCAWWGRCATVDIPDVNSDEYWLDGVFQHQRYERDVYKAIEAAGLKGRSKSCSLTKA
ncbi:hypothetical protein [Pantoea agglomerans]|nr:hypothetical protein [Pantoea agglomerans]MBD8223451.1 hypothetical protein [Pantoea agglomerans]TKK17219.1 hypothetical protein PagCFBP13516_16490 [Pantoea agglomerans]TKK27901.1 hypothetical protein PagCFBP13532_20535 [Pantoea agglomerans]